MALKLAIPFPIFAPPPNPNPNQNPNPWSHRPPTEVRFSRWNNAHAEKFNQRRRAQQEIEDDIRRRRRFDSATKIAQIYESATTNDALVKSTGTPSSPSKPSIPGKKSKYSKPAKPDDHPAFRRISKRTKTVDLPSDKPLNAKADIKVSEDGVSYLIDGAPFEFKYSYTDTLKVKPLKLREAAYAPFGPSTMSRPWTGRAPLPPSKKKLKEFDSFELPPANKKGVKPVQKPGPFLTGSGPKYVSSREEILGEPLTKEEVTELVNSCVKSNRQLNIGRDGLIHNMLENIHAHWKRRRVCKLKCKGVCTVDMDNVCQQLEERTGGKIIYRRGGVLFLFRGRNYNYKTRPRFPLMLWKPVTPVYPRLIQQAPEGLTLEEATDMRKKGRKLIPICKLGKNGVYCDLVKNVREAFEECELVRINCQGMNGSDYRRIGAKLRDLVPCVLISFQHEHILMWRGREWKSSLPKPENDSDKNKELAVHDANFVASPLEGSKDLHAEPHENLSSMDDNKPSSTSGAISTVIMNNKIMSYNTSCFGSEINNMGKIHGDVTKLDISSFADDESETGSDTYGLGTKLDNKGFVGEEPTTTPIRSETVLGGVEFTENNSASIVGGSLNQDQVQNLSDFSRYQNGPARLDGPNIERVSLLVKQAVESGIAMVLDDATLDADCIYEKSVAFAKSAPPGPVFRYRFRKIATQKSKKKDGDMEARREVSAVSERDGDLEVKKEVCSVSESRGSARQTSRGMLDKNAHCLNVAPQGSLRVDELAKLLA